jgi:hypothetical protein
LTRPAKSAKASDVGELVDRFQVARVNGCKELLELCVLRQKLVGLTNERDDPGTDRGDGCGVCSPGYGQGANTQDKRPGRTKRGRERRERLAGLFDAAGQLADLAADCLGRLFGALEGLLKFIRLLGR